VKRGRIQRLEIEELEVGRLHVRELVERWEGGLNRTGAREAST
jgi:hypothetical protein